MKNSRLLGIFRHALTMVGRTLKSYALLSVTIVLSFSLLLGYMVYTDGSLYNQYKVLFSQRRGDVIVTDYPMNNQKLQVFLSKLKDIDNTQYYFAYDAYLGADMNGYTLEGGDAEEGDYYHPDLHAILLPDDVWLDSLDHYMYPSSSDIVWLDRDPAEAFHLEADEVILDEKLYFGLGLDQEESPRFYFRSDLGFSLDLKVVGYSKSQEKLDYSADGWMYSTYHSVIFLSTKLMNMLTAVPVPETWDTSIVSHRYVVIYSENPEQVDQLCQMMKYEMVRCVYEEQNNALEAIRYEKRNKAIISMALLVLLGINLYSSFTNALNDRKFEIGVKRAVGASSWSIVRQFLYESLIVMAANIFLSVVLVTDVFIVYKYIYEHTPNEWGYYLSWILYISPYSIAMFAICAVTLTVVFSLIFAYQSTQVEIVQYLKAE